MIASKLDSLAAIQDAICAIPSKLSAIPVSAFSFALIAKLA
jgi:hypothetical protein